MYLLYADESNLDSRTEFFVYGGLSVPGECASELSEAIEQARSGMNVDPGFVLKFNPGPSHLDHREFISLKQSIIEAAVAAGCVFFAYVILHRIATDPDQAHHSR